MKAAQHERIRAYLDGELSREASEALLAEAARDEALGAELASQQALRALLRGAPRPRARSGLVPRERPWARLRRLPRWELRLNPLAAAAAALLLVAGGAGLGRVGRPAAPVALAAEQVPVRFVFTGEAKQVMVAGSFNGWSTQSTPLERVGDGLWEATVPLPRGEHRYLFHVDGRWETDPLAPVVVPDGMGHLNAVLKL